MKNTDIHIRVDEDLKKAVKQHAAETGRTLAGLIEWLLRKELKENGIAERQEGRGLKMRINTLTQNGAMLANQYTDRIEQLLREAGENPDEWEFDRCDPGNRICHEASVLVHTITPDWPEGDGWASRKYGKYDIAKDTLKIMIDEKAEYKSSYRKDRPDVTGTDIDNARERLRKSNK